ncbi:MAG TPA: polysaccharide deacetylase family protein [Chitinophagaceae bacterium]|nr:polysaccharide deacetylase family protein [Chitinophagaceae bacterium]
MLSNTWFKGAIIRGNRQEKKLAILFSADSLTEGGVYVDSVLQAENIKASFFFTGNYYRRPANQPFIKKLQLQGHYLGAHSNRHLLYCDWDKRDSLLIDRADFRADLQANYNVMDSLGISTREAHYFLPPYEWYNDSIAAWTRSLGLQLVNFSPGTLSNADYTWPELPNYRSNEKILESILQYESEHADGLNGFLLLMHFGTDLRRKEKFYHLLPALIHDLKQRGYDFCRIDELLGHGAEK